jgi:hypothetical protein
LNYNIKKGKYVIENEGIYFPITKEQVPELQALLKDMVAVYSCHADEGFPDCV